MSNIMGDRIKILRQQAGLTQEEFGKIIGVQKSAVRKYEKGDVENIPLTKIRLLCDRFHVDPCYLLGLSDSQISPEDSPQPTNPIDIIRSTYGDPACEMLEKFTKLDGIDQIKIIERMDMLLENEKYSVKESCG